MRWIYALDVPLASPEVLSLPPRPQQTLQYLLAGNSEKEIAANLGLALNTVHHYVKHLYRHFNVSSRSELLARWVKE
jgi:DNA-binding NarL/FixJ family response regulator